MRPCLRRVAAGLSFGSLVAGLMASAGVAALSALDRAYPPNLTRMQSLGTEVLDRQGRVHGSKLHKTSGYPVLDEAAVKMVERASPLPAMPPEMPDQTVELVVPVEFYIR